MYSDTMTLRGLKMFLFRRGYIPQGDYHDMLDRIKNRFGELPKLKLPGAASGVLLDSGEVDREAAVAAWRESANQTFIKIVTEEAEAQWARIIDRRAKDWFYSGIVSGILGFLLGKLT